MTQLCYFVYLPVSEVTVLVSQGTQQNLKLQKSILQQFRKCEVRSQGGGKVILSLCISQLKKKNRKKGLNVHCWMLSRRTSLTLESCHFSFQGTRWCWCPVASFFVFRSVKTQHVLGSGQACGDTLQSIRDATSVFHWVCIPLEMFLVLPPTTCQPSRHFSHSVFPLRESCPRSTIDSLVSRLSAFCEHENSQQPEGRK